MSRNQKKFAFMALLMALLMVFAVGCGGGSDDDLDLIDEDVDIEEDIDIFEDEDEDEDLDEEEGDLLPEADLREIAEELSVAFNDGSLREMEYEQVRDEFFDGHEGELDTFFTSFTAYNWFVAGGKSDGYKVSVHFNNDTGKANGISHEFAD